MHILNSFIFVILEGVHILSFVDVVASEHWLLKTPALKFNIQWIWNHAKPLCQWEFVHLVQVSVDIPPHPGEDATMLMQTFECIALVRL